MKSYIQTQNKISAIFREYILLYQSLRKRSGDAEREAEAIVADYDKLTARIGRDIADCDLLEVGVGQMPLRLAYFSARAKSAVGIDLDVIAVRYSISEFFKTMKCNGFTRTVRTFGRQWLGLNTNLIRAFCARMGFETFPGLNVIQGDICDSTQLGSASFDAIISTNVFEPLAEPEKAVTELARLLRPGGVILVSTSHWGEANAKHDLDVMYRKKPARWAHLRPALQDEVVQHAYVNDLRIKYYTELLNKYFDNYSVTLVRSTYQDQLHNEPANVRDSGELPDYDDEELLCESLIIRSIGRV